MPEYKEEILAASGGLNYDDDQRLFEAGDTDYRLNVIPGAIGDTYVLTNLKGTTIKSHGFSHGADYDGVVYTSIGSCYDVKRNAIYYFIHSSGENHCILRYNIDQDSFDKIVWDNTYIGLDFYNPIDDAFVLDDFLYWNPRSSSPRAINVEWAYYDYISKSSLTSTVSAGDYVKERVGRVWLCLQDSSAGPFDPANQPDLFSYVDRTYNDAASASGVGAGFLNVERPHYNTTFALSNKITVTAESDTSYEFNNIRGNAFQFTYRIYRTNLGLSPAAPFTDTVGFYNYETYNGEFTGEITTDNKLKLGVRLPTNQLDRDETKGRTDYLFEYLEILFRKSTTSEWRSVVRLSPYEIFPQSGVSTYYEYDFYNDKEYEIVDSAAVEVAYNFLPITSKSQGTLDGNRVCYGGCTEGRNDVDTDVTLTPGYENVAYEAIIPSGAAAETWTEGSGNGILKTTYYSPQTGTAYIQYRIPDSGNLAVGGASAGHIIEANINGTYYRRTLTATDVLNNNNYAAAWASLLNNDSNKIWTVQTGPYITSSTSTVSIDIELARYTASTSSDQQNKYSSFKTGAWHDLCIYYYDEIMRRSDAVKLDSVYISTLPELRPTETTGTGYRRSIDYSISHTAPSWAKWWGVGYAGNSSISEFWQYNISAAAVSADGDERDGYSYVDISPLQGITNDSALDYNFLNSTIEAYTFTEGDRIRFMTSINSSAVTESDLIIDDWSSVQHDYEIVDYDSSTKRLYFNSSGVIGDGTGGSTDYNDPSVIVEIYRRNLESSNKIYYEVGPLYAVEESAGIYYHNAGTQNQDASNPATGTIIEGDVKLITRTLSKIPTASWNPDETPVFSETYAWSDFYDSVAWSKGKPGADINIGEKALNIVRYSNRYVKNTLSSGLGTFDGLDYKTLSYNHGDITAVRQVGDTLKVIFENNVASVLVNKTQFYNADGTSQVVKSDEVLGSVNYSEEIWGSVNPESVLLVDRNLYFFDLRRKAYVRNAPNGSFPISDYKMKKYFIDKSNEITAFGEDSTKVYSAYDDDRGLVYVAFSANDSLSDIVLFHEPSNRWATFHSDWSETYFEPINFIDESLGTTIDFDLTNSQSGGNNSTITAAATGAYNDNQSFTERVINLKKGQRIDFSIYPSGSSPTLAAITYFKIDSSDQSVFADVEFQFSAIPYTVDVTVTDDVTLTFYINVNGSDSFTSGDYVDANWLLTIYENGVPILGSTPSEIYSMIGEDIYLHNDSSTRCYFWNAQNTYTARIYGGLQYPNAIKTFDAIAIHSNASWDVEDIQIPATVNYPNGMQSEIPEGHFEEDEGVFRSDYLCNMKTTSDTANVPDLLNGDTLRGYTIYNDLVGDETTEHNLYKVDIIQRISKM
jgi:hypothetical protein